MERWRQPATVIDVEEHPTQVYDMPDGRTFGGLRLTVDADTADRMRVGRMCACCQEPFEIAWPVLCPFCGVRVRDQQADYFERMYEGEEDIPATDWDAERDRIWEDLAREEEKKNGS